MRSQVLATEFDASAISTSVDWPSGQVLGSWRVVAALGRGGTAEVWRAVARDGHEAALKLVSPELRHHPAANALLQREHDVLRRVAAAELVRAYELFEHRGVAVLALEHLPRGDLVALAGAAPRHWLPAFAAVVGGLRALERHGLAHGDVKARNVLFAADGTARLADLTAARPLEAPAPATTAAYRWAAARGATAKDADCVAAAALLHELLTGRLPRGIDDVRCRRLRCEPHPPARAADALMAAAADALHAVGRVEGLSHFGDVIESVGSADV